MRTLDLEQVVQIIRKRYGSPDTIPLHAPWFGGKEREYLTDCIDSTFVSSVGKYVDRFESLVQKFTNASRAVAVVNGTNGLHLALRLVGVQPGDEVITQALTFVATTNAIAYQQAYPVFVDVDRDTLGLSPDYLRRFLSEHTTKTPEGVVNKTTGRRIAAVVPMHTFGHPIRIKELVAVCNEYGLPVVEDAAESLGSVVDGVHTGLFGTVGVLSFNGNKTITTGGGGMLITNDQDLGQRAKHLSTTAKVPSRWDFYHDEVGFNYRMPNINAALGCAQFELISTILQNKRSTADYYNREFAGVSGIEFITEPEGSRSNYWLNAVILESREARDKFLDYTNSNGIQTRPIWILQNKLPMNTRYQTDELLNSQWLEDRVVNIPSGVIA